MVDVRNSGCNMWALFNLCKAKAHCCTSVGSLELSEKTLIVALQADVFMPDKVHVDVLVTRL